MFVHLQIRKILLGFLCTASTVVVNNLFGQNKYWKMFLTTNLVEIIDRLLTDDE
jgi:hypothetical protein